jgi:hypothetical protein
MKHAHIDVRISDLPEVRVLITRLAAVADAAQEALSPIGTVRHSRNCDFLAGCDCGLQTLRDALAELDRTALPPAPPTDEQESP